MGQGDWVMVTTIGLFRSGMVGEVIKLGQIRSGPGVLVHFDKKRWRSKDGWFRPSDLEPASAIDRLGRIDA